MNTQISIVSRSEKLGLSAILLSALWILSLAGAVWQSLTGQQVFVFLVGFSGLAFSVGLMWALGRAKSAAIELPEPEIFTARSPGFWVRTLLLFLGSGLAFFLGMIIGTGLSMVLVCSLLGLGLSLAWRHTLTLKIAGMGLAAGLISALSTVFLGTGDLSWAVVNLITIPPAFTGGAMLLYRTQLGHVRLLEGQTARGLTGFLFGCVLALPAGLLNLLGDMQRFDAWISHWWNPLYAITPAIAEETWARLFLVSFCYALLRPVTNHRPWRAIVVATLISSFAWGFAHTGINPIGIVFGALLHGLPEVLLLIKKDFEHAVGYHFLIDFLRFIASFLSTQV